MRGAGSFDVLATSELKQVCNCALRILADVGVVVENRALLELLADRGAKVDFEAQRARFSRKWTEGFLAEAAREYPDEDGLEMSCLFPYGRRAEYSGGVECTAGTYPQYCHTLEGQIVPHTQQTVADITRLADALPNIDRLGAMGVPSDVPGALGPLYMRLNAWKHAANKPSGCGEVRNLDLIPYILEMGRIMAAAKGLPVRRYSYAEVELISPLKFTQVEAEIFVRFWKEGLLAGIGFMHSAGGSAPVTLAGTVALDLAESLFVNFLYRFCYGWKKLWLQTNSSVLDMKTMLFPMGRPERGLLALAMGQIARRYGAGLWASVHFADAKLPGPEAGMQAAYTTVPAVLAGATGLECFGLLSSAEMNSFVQLAIDNEFCGGLKRLARGFAVDKGTLAFDLIKETGPGGYFTACEHTVEHFRQEHWQPDLFTRDNLNAWLAGDRKTELDKAEDLCRQILRDHRPRNIDEPTEKELLKVIDRARRDLQD